MKTEVQPDVISSAPMHEQEGDIGEKHRIALERTLRIAGMVGSELAISLVQSAEDIPAVPGVYLIEGEVDAERYGDIDNTAFEFSAKSLSGKANSAHAVLPGTLSVSYEKPDYERQLEVAAKGYYKRPFADSFERVKAEVAISKRQEEAGEIAFQPVAVVIAPPPFHGKGTDFTDYDILLVTRLVEATETLDNTPWQFGFQPGNLEAAEAAVSALGRFNTTIGHSGDSKIKNFAQQPDGKTSLIDFETSHEIDFTDPAAVATTVLKDLGLYFDSLLDTGFFSQDTTRTYDVITKLGEIYLDHWQNFPGAIQDVVCDQVTEILGTYISYAFQQAAQQASLPAA